MKKKFLTDDELNTLSHVLAKPVYKQSVKQFQKHYLEAEGDKVELNETLTVFLGMMVNVCKNQFHYIKTCSDRVAPGKIDFQRYKEAFMNYINEFEIETRQ